MTYLRVLRNRFLGDIRPYVRVCSDLQVFGQYSLSGKALGFVTLHGESGRYRLGDKFLGLLTMCYTDTFEKKCFFIVS